MYKYLVVLIAVVALTQGAKLTHHALASLSSRINGRIVNGTEADIINIPYQVSLQLRGSHICGGAIISDRWIITAAHCLLSPAPLLTVRVGSSLHASGGTVHQIMFTVTHHKYIPLISTDWDYGLCKTMRSFALGKPGVASIQLATETPRGGEIATVSGWGTLSSGGDLPPVLMEVQIPIIAPDECAVMYSDEEYDITERMICAGLPEGGKDSCQGDSGGPLTVDNKLVGCVSWGEGCAKPDAPGVYSNVPLPEVREWIYLYANV